MIAEQQKPIQNSLNICKLNMSPHVLNPYGAYSLHDVSILAIDQGYNHIIVSDQEDMPVFYCFKNSEVKTDG